MQDQLNSLNEIYKNQTNNLNESILKNNEMKLDLEKKEIFISTQINEINDLNQKTNQLNQIVSDLELKKIELMEKVLYQSNKDNSENENDEQKNSEILIIIKVLLYFLKFN